MNDKYMELALELAKQAFDADEVPVGAVIVDAIENKIIVQTHNLCEQLNDPTAHAEMLAIREATKIIGNKRLINCDLYVTMEPCPMCAAAISFARIRRLYFGCYDPKSGGVEHGPKFYNSSSCHHRPEVYGGIYENEAKLLLQSFFKQKR